jgi:hypothetical protein
MHIGDVEDLQSRKPSPYTHAHTVHAVPARLDERIRDRTTKCQRGDQCLHLVEDTYAVRLSLRWKIAGGFGVLVALILALSWVTFSLFGSLRNVQRKV